MKKRATANILRAIIFAAMVELFKRKWEYFTKNAYGLYDVHFCTDRCFTARNLDTQQLIEQALYVNRLTQPLES